MMLGNVSYLSFKINYLILVFILSVIVIGDLPAQNPTSSDTAKTVWPSIETQLDQQTSDTAFHFILLLVQEQCNQDYECLYQTYFDIRNRLERERFNLLATIYVCEEMIAIAQQQKDLKREADGYKNLSRYHGALGNLRLSVLNADKALAIYKKTGNQYAIISAKMKKLERSISYRKLEDILPEMDALLEESMESRDTPSIIQVNLRIIQYKLQAKRYEEAEKHIEALESIPVSNPIKINEYRRVINASLRRADLAKARNNEEEAEYYYQNTLHLAKAYPDWWIATHVLQSLANLEYERSNVALAKSYIDEAQNKAIELELHDLLTGGFELQAKIAEVEGDFTKAFEYLKKQQFHKEKLKERNSDFDLRRYYLKVEKEALASEKEKKELELKLQTFVGRL